MIVSAAIATAGSAAPLGFLLLGLGGLTVVAIVGSVLASIAPRVDEPADDPADLLPLG